MTLIRRMSKDDGEFEKLLGPLVHQLYYMALDMTGHPADAEDVSQETVVKALRAFGTFKPESAFKPWIFRILTNTVIDFYRTRRRPLSLLDDGASAPADNHAPLPASAASEEVEEALRDLEPGQRLAVLLVDLHDFSMKEAAEMMGCPGGTLGSRLARGRAALRRRLTR